MSLESRERYRRRYENGQCGNCGRVRDRDNRKLCSHCLDKAEYKKTRNQATTRFHQRTRQQAIQVYGGKCLRCGFTDWRALQFDHVNGDGASDRKAQKYYYGFLRRLIANPDFVRYQLLCANCNWIKKYERNENPR